MKSYYAKKEQVQRNWIIVDLNGKTLGRAATKIADILRGKNKPTYTPGTDTGDFVVAINAKKVKMTGNKVEDKMYYRYSGYMGGLKEANAKVVLEKEPTHIIKHAVKGMLPRGPLGRAQLKKFKVYAGTEHPHAAQKPQVVEL